MCMRWDAQDMEEGRRRQYSCSKHTAHTTASSPHASASAAAVARLHTSNCCSLRLTCSDPIALSMAAAMSPRRACCCSSSSCSKVTSGQAEACTYITVTHHRTDVTRHTSHLFAHISPSEYPPPLPCSHNVVQCCSGAPPAPTQTLTHLQSHAHTCTRIMRRQTCSPRCCRCERCA